VTGQPNLKYSHIERERRFLLSNPPSRDQMLRVLHIHDRYLRGTRLRLRLIEESGCQPVRKLGQKVRLDETSPLVVAHTTMYLTDVEFSALLALPADDLTKTRHVLSVGDAILAIDVFHGTLNGLVLAEVDLGETGTILPTLPAAPLAEVTNDERFTGGMLAATSAADVRSLLREYGVR
jgi:CYTH domain-containing protein